MVPDGAPLNGLSIASDKFVGGLSHDGCRQVPRSTSVCCRAGMAEELNT